MSADHTIRVAFKGTIGNFSLDAAFTAPAAGVTALFGPSGCGKTTVLRCIAGLLAFSRRLRRRRRCVAGRRTEPSCPRTSARWAMCSRRPAFFRTFPSGATSCSARRAIAGARQDRFDEVVELIGVASLLQRSPRNLSGGERQRVAIGRALLSQPTLLLMDEPSSALDRAAKDEIMPFLERLRDRHLMPIVYISHDIAEVERLADQLVLMDKGRAIAAGPLADLQSDPSLPLASAREAAVTLEGTVEAHDPRYGLLTLGVRGGRFLVPAPPASIGDHRRLRIVARDVSLARETPGLSSILNSLPGRVVSARLINSNEMLAVVALGAEGSGARLLSRLTRKSWEQLALAEGMSVYVQVKAVALDPRRGDLVD